MSFYLTLIGAPGSGKGTQIGKLSTYFKLPVIAMGEIIRSEIKNESKLGLIVKDLVAAGNLVSDEYIVSIFEKAIENNIIKTGVILDGYPRTLLQSKSFYSVFSNQYLPLKIVYLKTSFQTIKERLLGRLVCLECNSIFHSKYQPPQKTGYCDKCSARLTVRADDNEDSVRNRYEIYLKEVEPVLDFFSKQVVTVDANNSFNNVFDELLNILQVVET